MPVIGYLASQSADDEYKNVIVPFLQGLKEAGYVEGQNVAIEYRWADGQYDRLPAMAAELVRLQVAVIVCNTPGALAAKAATTTTPIVFTTSSDPVQIGLVASLSRPGGNVTGATSLSLEVSPRHLIGISRSALGGRLGGENDRHRGVWWWGTASSRLWPRSVGQPDSKRTCCSEIQRAQRLAPFRIGTVHGYGYRLEAEDRRRLMGTIEEHKDFVSKDNRERATPCNGCLRSEGKIVEMALIRIEPSGVSG
jgi:hypothetical protein